MPTPFQEAFVQARLGKPASQPASQPAAQVAPQSAADFLPYRGGLAGTGQTGTGPFDQTASVDPLTSNLRVLQNLGLNVPGGGQFPTFFNTLTARLGEFRNNPNFGQDMPAILRSLAGGGLQSIGTFQTPAALAAGSNLLDILFSQGRTDPAMLNRELADIARTGQSVTDATRGELARQGLGQSGLGQALMQAQQGATAERRAGRLAQESQISEQRRRDDLNLFANLVLSPLLDMAALERGQALSNRQLQAQQSNQLINSLLGLGGGVANIFSGFPFQGGGS